MEEITLSVYRNTIRKKSFQGRNTRRMTHFQDSNASNKETLSKKENRKDGITLFLKVGRFPKLMPVLHGHCDRLRKFLTLFLVINMLSILAF